MFFCISVREDNRKSEVKTQHSTYFENEILLDQMKSSSPSEEEDRILPAFILIFCSDSKLFVLFFSSPPW